MISEQSRLFQRLESDAPEEFGDYPIAVNEDISYPDPKIVDAKIPQTFESQLEAFLKTPRSLLSLGRWPKGKIIFELLEILVGWSIELDLLVLSRWRTNLLNKEYSKGLKTVVILKECNEVTKAARELMAVYATVNDIQRNTTCDCRGFLVYMPNALESYLAGSLTVRCVALQAKFVAGKLPELNRSYPVNFDISSDGVFRMEEIKKLRQYLLSMDPELVVA
eukprot:Gregarina_sp_Poly_1__694@NODE_1165_length_4880_cov_74_173073_g599_i1_p2_GENE_NODE_1165_length_4880_cov_74_173073_g599_i1NODE_1165_length_4880_cov_74_173073_g599_i1_p2_ORF_typecomplete_len222_score32_01_NODE_1165_length_4880_cov_74_173073_g599_i19641629